MCEGRKVLCSVLSIPTLYNNPSKLNEMVTPKLTPAFNIFVKVALPAWETPGNENSSLIVVHGRFNLHESS